ncbi:MAG: hypothetical protein DI604_33250 [Delftia acidovorans]|nr:MAG: hypothetical protein DI604_33250 [Delftia acidovorans]
MLKLDCLFNILGGVFFMIIALLAQIHPPTENEKQPQPGNIVASIAWPEGAADVDLWVSGPDGKGIGYSNKSGAVWSLLRDDLGASGDSTPLNYENAFTRGIPDGEYGVNVRCYVCGAQLPVSVVVEVRIVGGPLIWTGAVELVADKQERTAIRWKMAGGRMVTGSESFIFKNMRGEG